MIIEPMLKRVAQLLIFKSESSHSLEYKIPL